MGSSGPDGVFAVVFAWQAHPWSSRHPLRMRTPSPDLGLLSRLHAPATLPCCPVSWTGIPGRTLPDALARIAVYEPFFWQVPETRLTVSKPMPEELPVTLLAPLPPGVHTRAVVVGVSTRCRGLAPQPSVCRDRPAPSGRMPPHFACPARPPPPSPAASPAACSQKSPCLVDFSQQVCFPRRRGTASEDIPRPKGEDGQILFNAFSPNKFVMNCIPKAVDFAIEFFPCPQKRHCKNSCGF